MIKLIKFIIIPFFLSMISNIEAQNDLTKIKSTEAKLIRNIKKMKHFPENQEFDHQFIVYDAYILPKDWSLESIKNSTVLDKLIFEKKVIKKAFCKNEEILFTQVYFVNTNNKREYFYTDGDLFYSERSDLDHLLVDNLIENDNLMFINISNLTSDIYFAVDKDKLIKKIFDRKLGKCYDLNDYLNQYSTNLTINDSFDFLYTK